MNEIELYGVIGLDVMPADIKAELEMMDDADMLVVRIDSQGGSAFAGNSIYSALKNYDGPKKAIVESFAGSIASYILTAFDQVEITANGYVMIHNPTMASDGDDEAHARDAKLLASVKAEMVKAYSERMNARAEEVEAMMKAGTFFNAEEALANGLVTSIEGQTKPSVAVMAHVNDLPYRVVASLSSEAPSGDNDKPKENPVAEPKDPVAATVKQIKAAFPKMSEKFVLACLEKELPMAQVAEEAADTLQAENEQLRSELEDLKSQAEEAKAQAEAETKAQSEAKAEAQGNQPVATATNQPGMSAGDRWSQAVQACMKEGMTRSRAVQAANRRNPGLRAEMLAEVNA